MLRPSIDGPNSSISRAFVAIDVLRLPLDCSRRSIGKTGAKTDAATVDIPQAFSKPCFVGYTYKEVPMPFWDWSEGKLFLSFSP